LNEAMTHASLNQNGSRSAEPIHFINSMWNVVGGSEERILYLRQLLEGHRPTRLWSDYAPDPQFAARWPVTRTNPRLLRFPKRGTFVFIGVHFNLGPWVAATAPRRIIVVCNVRNPAQLKWRVARLSAIAPTEIVYSSRGLAELAGLPGRVEPSPIDIRRFAPAPKSSGPFTVGRMSRDTNEKHHPDDAALYRSLVEQGCRVEIMGPSPALCEAVSGSPGIRLVEPGSVSPEAFLHRLDCFLYRTSSDWIEPWGRVITEAMASGLPVVCHRRGGYSEIIEHGRNGLVFETQSEALAAVLALKIDPSLGEGMGREARKAMEAMFSEEALARTVDYYLQ
jgi:glycosyltransferase involved in cell wall biosynthesis